MTTEHYDPSVQPSRKISTGKLALVCVLVVLLLFTAVFAIGSFVSARQLQAELDKICAAGEPMTMADLEAFYARPAKDRDATQLWLEAFAVLNSPAYKSDAKGLPIVGEIETVLSPREPWPQLDAAEAFLAKYRGPLEKIHQASAMGGEARFSINRSDPIEQLLPHFRQHDVVRLLRVEAEVLARRNDSRAAAESVRAIFAAARSLEGYPFLYTQLVRMGLNADGCSQIERLLSNCGLSEHDLARFDRALARIDDIAAYRQGLLCDRAWVIDAFENPAKLGPDAPAKASFGPLRNIDEIGYLRVMQMYVAASRSTILPLHEAIGKARDEVATIMASPSARWRFSMTRQLMPSLEESTQPSVRASLDCFCRAQASQAATRTGIAIERYRRVYGAAPATLDELVPEFLDQPPVDPFDRAPLRFKSDATGYKVYSIGPDSIDQGGEPGKEEQELDIVFEVSFEAHTGAGGSPNESERTEPTPGREK